MCNIIKYVFKLEAITLNNTKNGLCQVLRPTHPSDHGRVLLVYYNIILLFYFINSRLNAFINAAIVAVYFFYIYTGDIGVVIIQFLLRQSSSNFYKNKTPIIFSLPLRVNHRECTYICYILYNTALFSAFFFAEKVYDIIYDSFPLYLIDTGMACAQLFWHKVFPCPPLHRFPF